MENSNLFKPKDKVYHHRFGWCTVMDTTSYTKIQLEDYKSDRCAAYSGELSFVEYNLVTGGLSHVRPIVLPKPGDVVYYYMRINPAQVATWTVGLCSSVNSETNEIILKTNPDPKCPLVILDLNKDNFTWSLKNPFTDELPKL